jgi:hypothetical protein
LSEDVTQAKQWLNEQPDLMSFYKKYDYEEMKEVLLNYLNPEQEAEVTEDEDESVVEKPTIQASTTYSEPATPKKKSTFDEDEFDALFTEAKPKASPFVEEEDDDLPF